MEGETSPESTAALRRASMPPAPTELPVEPEARLREAMSRGGSSTPTLPLAIQLSPSRPTVADCIVPSQLASPPTPASTPSPAIDSGCLHLLWGVDPEPDTDRAPDPEPVPRTATLSLLPNNAAHGDESAPVNRSRSKPAVAAAAFAATPLLGDLPSVLAPNTLPRPVGLGTIPRAPDPSTSTDDATS